MTNDDFKQLLDQTVKPLQQGINELKSGQEELRSGQEELRSGQEELRKELNEVKNTIDTRVLPSLTYIETTVKSYADRYVANEDHIGRLDKRLTKVEENLGINPPEELTIPSMD